VASGDAFEYKYVIISADGEVRWESAIENRMYTPEGENIVLDDVRFNDKRYRQGNYHEHHNCTKEGFNVASSECTPERHFSILSDLGPGSRVRSSANMGVQTAW
jgi:hypothetical protein